ncbi:MAG TPA: hypothetical protein VFS59_11535 [Gemmatimonadaceae bacterium]|nr:hypothetical protein [Gemmatimonadaceae bacterium]
MRASILAATLLLTSALGAQGAPRALCAAPPRDTTHPARNAVLHVPTHGVQVQGLALLAAGAGRHPTLVFLRGLPGNEQGHDLAQVLAYVRESANARTLRVDTSRIVVGGHSMGGWAAARAR